MRQEGRTIATAPSAPFRRVVEAGLNCLLLLSSSKLVASEVAHRTSRTMCFNQMRPRRGKPFLCEYVERSASTSSNPGYERR